MTPNYALTKGDEGDNFYIIDEGTVEVCVVLPLFCLNIC